MTISDRADTTVLACPLCRGSVAVRSSGCGPCSLPMSAIVTHTADTRRGGSGLRRAIGTRVTGLVVYAGVVAWAWWQLPETLPFVMLGAGLGGGVLHVWRGRPVLGAVVFAAVVFLLPRLLWSAFGMGALSDLAGRF